MSVKHLLVQSTHRITGTPDKFKVPIPTLRKVGRVTLLSASIPNTIYNVTSRNNAFAWWRGSFHNTTLPPGAYDVFAVLPVLETAMNTVDPGNNYSVTYSHVTMKITIAGNAAFSVSATGDNSLAPAIGFERWATGMAESITAPNVVRLDLPPYLLISVDELGGATTRAWQAAANFCVSMGTNSGYVEVFNHLANYENQQNYSGVSMDHLNVRVCMPNGDPVDFNGADWSMLLSICYCA